MTDNRLDILYSMLYIEKSERASKFNLYWLERDLNLTMPDKTCWRNELIHPPPRPSGYTVLLCKEMDSD